MQLSPGGICFSSENKRFSGADPTISGASRGSSFEKESKFATDIESVLAVQLLLLFEANQP